MVTYSTKPRGGVVHMLALAEALARRSFPVEIVALGDESAGFYRPVAVPCAFVACPEPAAGLEARVFNAIDALEAGLRARAGALPPVLHVQDCIAARAALRIRDAGAPVRVVRTVHHVDDFTTPALVECQRRSIVDPDRVLVVSPTWRQRLADDYGVKADVVTNGIDIDRFAADPPAGATERAARSRGSGGSVPDPDRRRHRAPQGHRPPVSRLVAPTPTLGSSTGARHHRRPFVSGPHALSRPRHRVDG